MVERMKKLSVLIYSDFKESFLEGLQELGIVDVNIDFSIENTTINELKAEITRIKNAKRFILETLKDFKVKRESKPVLQKDLKEIINRIEKVRAEYESLSEKLKLAEIEISQLEKWGEFDPILIAKLEKEGIKVKFYSSTKEEFLKIEQKGYTVEKINQIGNTVYFVLFSTEEIELEEPKIEKLPMKKLSELITYKEHIKTLMHECKLEINSLSFYLEKIDDELNSLSDRLFYEHAKLNVGNAVEDKILFITGFFPAKNEKKLIEFLEEKEVFYIIENPSKDDNVPVKLKNNKFARLFEVITELNSLPQYYEVDPTPFTAPFFALFFGLCIADVGYGFIMLFATILAFFFARKNLKSIAALGIILSLATIISGVLLNTIFGLQLLSLPLPQELKKCVVFTDMNSAMAFAIFLGVIQVIVGYCLQVVNKVRIYGIAGGMQPLGVLFFMLGVLIYSILYLVEGDVVIGPLKIKNLLALMPFSNYVSISFIVCGLILILLFNNITQKFYWRPLLGLWELYGIVTGIPGDILSYLRLFALGLAGGLLGNAFNQIALMLKGDGKNIFGVIGMILILLVGHSLNLILAVLGAFVHPLRLTLLEFYKAIGFTGGGRPYRPFKKFGGYPKS
jgi:V/A-type H+-transporting ATPase subunit I